MREERRERREGREGGEVDERGEEGEEGGRKQYSRINLHLYIPLFLIRRFGVENLMNWINSSSE